MPFANPILAGTTLVREAIRSPNFAAGVSGWSIDKTGAAEFNKATIRGSLRVTSFDDLYVSGPSLFDGSVEFASPNTTIEGAPIIGGYHGKASVIITASTNGTAVVNFPAGAFSVPPDVALTISSGSGSAIRATVFAVALSAAQMTIRVDLSGAATVTIPVHWFAVPA